jgi:hypothetical protein
MRTKTLVPRKDVEQRGRGRSVAYLASDQLRDVLKR